MTTSSSIRPTNRNWLWYFAALVVLSAISITTLIVFNLSQQLTPGQLAAAIQRWKEKGPRDYDMTFTKTVGEPETFVVEVRAGQVVSAERNGQPLEDRLLHYYSMNELFSYIKSFQEVDAKPGQPKTFTVATFDPNDGHLLRYIRRVMGTKQRAEITVTDFTPRPSGGP
jgi:hypothetical protein